MRFVIRSFANDYRLLSAHIVFRVSLLMSSHLWFRWSVEKSHHLNPLPNPSMCQLEKVTCPAEESMLSKYECCMSQVGWAEGVGNLCMCRCQPNYGFLIRKRKFVSLSDMHSHCSFTQPRTFPRFNKPPLPPSTGSAPSVLTFVHTFVLTSNMHTPLFS